MKGNIMRLLILLIFCAGLILSVRAETASEFFARQEQVSRQPSSMERLREKVDSGEGLTTTEALFIACGMDGLNRVEFDQTNNSMLFYDKETDLLFQEIYLDENNDLIYKTYDEAGNLTLEKKVTEADAQEMMREDKPSRSRAGVGAADKLK